MRTGRTATYTTPSTRRRGPDPTPHGPGPDHRNPLRETRQLLPLSTRCSAQSFASKAPLSAPLLVNLGVQRDIPLPPLYEFERHLFVKSTPHFSRIPQFSRHLSKPYPTNLESAVWNPLPRNSKSSASAAASSTAMSASPSRQPRVPALSSTCSRDLAPAIGIAPLQMIQLRAT